MSNHMYPVVKGDQLCPLGFHPQVRWPTRCKRCFRDYKEHGNRRGGNDIAASSPSLTEPLNSRSRDAVGILDKPVRSWTSTQNLAINVTSNDHSNRLELPQRPASWASTPDLDKLQNNNKNNNNNKFEVTVNIPLPKRRLTTTFDDLEESFTLKRPPLPSNTYFQPLTKTQDDEAEEAIIINKSDSLAERVRKMNAMKRQGSQERDTSREGSITRKVEKEPEKPPEPPKQLEQEVVRRRRRPMSDSSEATSTASSATTTVTFSKPPSLPAALVKENVKTQSKESIKVPKETSAKPPTPKFTPPAVSKAPTNTAISDHFTNASNNKSNDIRFLMQVKDKTFNANKKNHDETNSTTTETTETTLTNHNDHEMQEEIEYLKRELETVKARCETLSRDKSDILLRRLASMDTGTNRTAASEALKLQQRCNELKQEVEELRDDKKYLTVKVKELQQDLNVRPTKSIEEQLRAKLEQAETLCEELMDENEEVKKEMRNMESEIDEMHDNFREDQADEYSKVKKELEQTTKNCRILSFKLKKSDRKVEQLEGEKQTLGAGQSNMDMAKKVKQLEDDLRLANEVARRLQAEAEKAEKNPLSPLKKKPPVLGKIGKSISAEGKISRESLTRGGSQEDPAQLLRDLQDSLEREADLREQLKFAEEEAENLRKKASRVDDENESLVMQLKKMATKARTRKMSPTPSRLTPEPIEKDEGISDEDDPAELRLQLELNEQETSVLRRKVEQLGTDNEASKRQIRDLQERLANKTQEVVTNNAKQKTSLSKLTGSKDPINEKKLQVMEEEMTELRKKFIEKDRDVERLEAELSLSKTKGSKGSVHKSKSLDDQNTNLDIKRQLQVVEQEATVLRTKTQSLEQENDKLLGEIKLLQLQAARSTSKSFSLTSAKEKAEASKMKETLELLEKERDALAQKLKTILEESVDKLPKRAPKRYVDTLTKLQLKKMFEENEEEIKEMQAIILRTGGDKLSALEAAKSTIEIELKEMKDQLQSAQAEIKSLKSKKDVATTQTSSKLKDVETKLQQTESDNKVMSNKIATLEDKLSKQEANVKQAELLKSTLEVQLKQEKDKISTFDKDLNKEKREKIRLETKVTVLDNELQVTKTAAEKTKELLDKEIKTLKEKAAMSNDIPSKKLQEFKEQNRALEETILQDKKDYTDLNAKFELLEEEHVMFKAKLSIEKEQLQTEIQSLRYKIRDYELAESKLKKENLDFKKKVDELERRQSDLSSKSAKVNALEYEKKMLANSLEEKQREYDTLREENNMNTNQVSVLKKENDDLSRKLNDFERINKVQRTMNEQNSALEQDVKALKMKLDTAEIAIKSEVAATRLRYETQAKNLQAEMNSLQRQCERFKRDRDTYKQLLEAAQKTIGEMKQHHRRSAISSSSGEEDEKSQIASLEQQVGCLEDELSEARLEASKLRTELVSEKSSAEVKMSEMQSKMNELEEDKILAGGRTKVPGTKTRLELSWQKEREEQQRILQETATLARDLRQTLFEVEREKDRERLESRRKIDQVKKSTEEELEEGRRKISELQSDLLELRDAHAKLRTANEKLRRDRDRYEKERDNTSRRRFEQDGDRKVGILLQTVDELVKVAPELQKAVAGEKSKPTSSSSSLPIPSAPQRGKSRSPSPSRSTTVSTQKPQELSLCAVLAQLAEASEDLRRYQRLCEDERDRERVRRTSMRRAASTENDNGIDSSSHRSGSRLNRNSQNGGSLYRKSLSLDQSMQQEQTQMIWKQDDDSMSSLQSIDSDFGAMRRDSSMDSRLSTGSTQSDMPRQRKKKRGLIGKLRSLTSRGGTESDMSQHGSDSDLSLAGDIRGSKKDLKGRLSGMFKRAGSSSRSNSTEKILTDSMQRPVAMVVNKPETSHAPMANSEFTEISGRPPTRHVISAPHLSKTGKPPTPTTPSTLRNKK